MLADIGERFLGEAVHEKLKPRGEPLGEIAGEMDLDARNVGEAVYMVAESRFQARASEHFEAEIGEDSAQFLHGARHSCPEAVQLFIHEFQFLALKSPDSAVYCHQGN